jgi:hypothetical protein
VEDDFDQSVAQNMVQLESALSTDKKRMREAHAIDGEEEPPTELKAYGIVTNASQWMLLECTLYEDETVLYRLAPLKRIIYYGNNWQDATKFIFERLVWLSLVTHAGRDGGT